MKKCAVLTVGKSLGLSLALVASLVLADQALATNLVVNGSFESENQGFSSAYTYQPNLYPAGVYYVGANPNTYHANFASIAAQDGSLMMILNGASVSGTNVWREDQISVMPNTTYYFSTWVASVTAPSPAILNFSINGASIGTLNATSDSGWHQFYATWNSGNSTTADLALVNINTVAGGNDFALDNIVLDTINPTNPVPEPGTMLLLGAGFAGLVVLKRKGRTR